MTDEQFRALDAERLKTTYDADAIWLNGPRRALMDAATAVRTSEEDLVVPARGDAHIVFDEFENNYQRVGG